jgi:hypothetical protein
MPFRIPFTSVVVTGHRGTALTDRQGHGWVKTLSGQPKDDWAARRRQAGEQCLLPPPRPRGLLPTFSVKRVTDYTRYTGPQALAKAASKAVLEFTLPNQVVDAVTRHLTQRLPAPDAPDARSAAPLILVGDAHTRRSARR